MLLQRAVFGWVTRVLLALRSVFKGGTAREAEILVLRQQLLVLSRKSRKAGPLAEHRSADFRLIIYSIVGLPLQRKDFHRQ